VASCTLSTSITLSVAMVGTGVARCDFAGVVITASPVRLLVDPETRSLMLIAEVRALPAQGESRALPVLAESRRVAVSGETRTLWETLQ
jgi:hypothetical protein